MSIMRYALLLLLSTAALAQPASRPANDAKRTYAPEGYRLAFSDDFDGTSLDGEKWKYRTGPRHWSWQKSDNVSVANGLLRLHLKKEKVQEYDYTAGGVISRDTFRHGYYEARLRVPAGKGWHTSFWLMQSEKDARQEIDICEQDSVDPGSYTVNVHQWHPTHKSFGARSIRTPDLSKDFHIFGCEFTASEAKFYFDGQLVHTADVSKIEHGEHNVWLTSIASGLGNTDSVDETKLPAVAEFDWVKVYVKK